MTNILSSAFLKATGLMICSVLLSISVVASIVFGTTEISWGTAVEAFVNYDETSNEHIIIQMTRLPRAVIAGVVGASLAISGVLLQILSKNPLAAPDTLGINAGAAFFVVLAATVLSVSSIIQLMWFSFLGAAVSAAAVYGIGSVGRDGLTPVKMILAGAAMMALFVSFTQGMLVINEKGLDEVMFWLTGSVAGRSMEMATTVLPFMIFGWIGALLMSRSMNVLAMGDDVAKGLGQRTVFVKGIMMLLVVLLAGSAVSVAGPILFIGVVIPHIARFLVGNDYRWIVPYCALLGALLLISADTAARFFLQPSEVPVGVMTVIIGIPFFVYIARKGFNKA